MKTFTITVFLLFSSIFTLFADDYPPHGWTSDILEALSESEESGKDILLNFTGSDWCSLVS